MKYPLATSSWGDEEVEAACAVIKSGMCTMGAKCKEFEETFARMLGSKYAIFSNSGSSANLLMMTALMYRKNGPKLEVGDEVIVPAVSWSTSYFPIHQNGLICSFVDIDKHTLNIDVNKIEEAITEKTKAILAVNLLGNPNNFNRLNEICIKHNLILLEDNCESAFAKYDNKNCGTFGLMGSHSSFFSHHFSTIEGGITLTDDEELAQLMVSIRAHGWTRGLPDKNFVHDKDGIPFNDLFRFVLPGYNLRPNEVFASIGLEQLKKIPNFISDRIKNADYFNIRMRYLKNKYPGTFSTQFVASNAISSWFGFAFILDTKLKGKRLEIVEKLTKENIECRPIVAGNMAKNPVLQHMKVKINGNLEVADDIDQNGLFIGNNQGNIINQIEHFVSTFDKIIEQLVAKN